MPHVTKHEPGMFSWAELATTDSVAAAAFCKELLGLTAPDLPVDDNGTFYRILLKDGKAVCALFDLTGALKTHRVPVHWSAFFTVEDVDQTVTKAKELGASTIQEPHDVFNAGRHAEIRDPEGATFAVWQPKDGIGAEVFAEPGALVWSELFTTLPEAEAGFYGGLFGWSRMDTIGAGGLPYMLFQSGGRNAAGMMTILEEWGAVSPSWLVYFAVQDCEATIRKAIDLKGSLVLPAAEIPDLGRFALLTDPQGANFFILEMAQS